MGWRKGPPLSNDPGDVSLLLRTSGTTSRPKGVPLAQGQLVQNAGSLAASLSLTPADVADSERRGSVVSMHSLASVPPPTGKPRMLRLLCKRHGVADRASVLFFDDDERNVADCVAVIGP